MLKQLNPENMDETFILTIITLTITVLAAVEIPRLVESGIIRTIFLSNIARSHFYRSQSLKYVVIFILSYIIGMTSLKIAFLDTVSWKWILERFWVYFIITVVYMLFAQWISIIFQRTVESLMSCLLLLYVATPVLNSYFKAAEFYQKLPFLYLEPKNMLTLDIVSIWYSSLLLIFCGAVFLYLGIRKVKRLEV